MQTDARVPRGYHASLPVTFMATAPVRCLGVYNHVLFRQGTNEDNVDDRAGGWQYTAQLAESTLLTATVVHPPHDCRHLDHPRSLLPCCLCILVGDLCYHIVICRLRSASIQDVPLLQV